MPTGVKSPFRPTTGGGLQIIGGGGGVRAGILCVCVGGGVTRLFGRFVGRKERMILRFVVVCENFFGSRCGNNIHIRALLLVFLHSLVIGQAQ